MQVEFQRDISIDPTNHKTNNNLFQYETLSNASNDSTTTPTKHQTNQSRTQNLRPAQHIYPVFWRFLIDRLTAATFSVSFFFVFLITFFDAAVFAFRIFCRMGVFLLFNGL